MTVELYLYAMACNRVYLETNAIWIIAMIMIILDAVLNYSTVQLKLMGDG